jgi:hypothetical protein
MLRILSISASSSVRLIKARQREAYLSYLEMLNKLQLFCAANSIVRIATATATAVCMYCNCSVGTVIGDIRLAK